MDDHEKEAAFDDLFASKVIQIMVIRHSEMPDMVVAAVGGDMASARRLALVDRCMRDAVQNMPRPKCMLCQGEMPGPMHAAGLAVVSRDFEAPDAKAVFYLVCRPCGEARPDNAVFYADIRREFGGTLIQHEAGHA